MRVVCVATCACHASIAGPGSLTTQWARKTTQPQQRRVGHARDRPSTCGLRAAKKHGPAHPLPVCVVNTCSPERTARAGHVNTQYKLSKNTVPRKSHHHCILLSSQAAPQQHILFSRPMPCHWQPRTSSKASTKLEPFISPRVILVVPWPCRELNTDTDTVVTYLRQPINQQQGAPIQGHQNHFCQVTPPGHGTIVPTIRGTAASVRVQVEWVVSEGCQVWVEADQGLNQGVQVCNPCHHNTGTSTGTSKP